MRPLFSALVFLSHLIVAGRLILTSLLILASAGTHADNIATAESQLTALSFDAALDLAERNTPLLAAQSEKIAAAQAAAIPAAALPDPKLALGVENLPIAGSERGQLNGDSMTMQKIGLMQEFPAAAKRSARAEIANAATERVRAERSIARQKVRAETAQAWLQRFYLEQQIALLAALAQENQLLSGVVQARVASGSAATVDALLPQQETLSLADRRDVLQQQIDGAKALLKQWLGDAAYLPLSGGAPPLDLDIAALNRHVHKHPELAAYGPMTAQAEAELREAQAQKQSDWSVELDYQRRGLYPDMVSLQFTYALPVSMATRQTPNIVAKQRALAQLDYERESMLREHVAQLEVDGAMYRSLQQQLQRVDDASLPLAQQKVDLSMAGYRAGQSDLASVLTARRELLELKIRRLDLFSQQAQLSAKLHFAYEEIGR
ncbi:MAG TPA: TolC family protein [Spongiibacteraceae bacterium]|nr:TolC family protein [Spongiibacteraceae bacterium]